MKLAKARDGGVDDRTRTRVARLLLEGGPATAGTLGERLGLTPAAVRRHLDAMLADGTIVAREPKATRLPRGRGRPARVFALTDGGFAAVAARLPAASGYDGLAAAALRFVERTGGPAAVTAFAHARVAELERRYRPRLGEQPGVSRSQALAEALSADGYAATAEPVARSPYGAESLQICQHHCPVQAVAAEFPQLCDAETAAFGRLLGSHVQRLATIAHGDGVCTTHVPLTKPREVHRKDRP